VNAATHRQHSGINVLILWGAVIERGFSIQNWLTASPAAALAPRAATRPPRRREA
jgi:antirestriction protein ArdC